jgi:quinol monooxygenase YgiN
MFVYHAVQEKPSTDVLWFKDANPAAYDAIIEAVKSAPGYLNGTWQQDPADPKKFLITHSWDSRAAWKAMSDNLKNLSAMQLGNAYRETHNIKNTVSLGV